MIRQREPGPASERSQTPPADTHPASTARAELLVHISATRDSSEGWRYGSKSMSTGGEHFEDLDELEGEEVVRRRAPFRPALGAEDLVEPIEDLVCDSNLPPLFVAHSAGWCSSSAMRSSTH